MDHAVQKTPERDAFYRKIDGQNLSALWNVMGDLITPQPKSPCRPHLWTFDAIRSYMMEAGQLITAKEAEQRVLILENPGLRGQSKVTTSLNAGIQLVMPGEVAPAHRHSQSALRFILEGKGAHTAVDGERTNMESSDFRDHAVDDVARSRQRNLGADLLARRARHSAGAVFSTLRSRKVSTRTSKRSPVRTATALLAMATICCRSISSEPRKLLRYSTIPMLTPGKRLSRQETKRLGRLSRPEAAVHQSGDRRLRNANDRHVHPVAAERFSHRALSLDGRNRVCLIEGRGRSRIGDQTFEWGSRDIFVVPSWHWVAHEADEEAVLFSFSDRPVQQKLDLFREDRGNA